MKHKVLSHVIANQSESIFSIELIPETTVEANAIKKARSIQSNKIVREYLDRCLGERYSIEDTAVIGKGRYKMIAFDNESGYFFNIMDKLFL
jgi:hypothetical protein